MVPQLPEMLTNTRYAGLNTAEAAARLRRDGPNLLPQPERRRWIHIVRGVVREPMLLLLLAASGLYLVLGDARDAADIAVLRRLDRGAPDATAARRDRRDLSGINTPAARMSRNVGKGSLDGRTPWIA